MTVGLNNVVRGFSLNKVFTSRQARVRGGRILVSFLMAILLVASAFYRTYPANAFAQEETIQTEDEFFDRLSEQINSRTVSSTFKMDSDLVASLSNTMLEKYSRHYNPDKPLVSGCYLSYYLTWIHYTYGRDYIKTRITFPYSSSEMDSHFAKMDQLAVELKGKNDYETVKNVHDYLIRNYEYDAREKVGNHTDIDGFKEGVMVCTGYSLASYYLLNANGIETLIITGNGGGENSTDENHMWNAVKVNGKWYNYDVTWDDDGTTPGYRYFLKSDGDFPGHTRFNEYKTSSGPLEIASKSYSGPLQINPYKVFMFLAIAFAVIATILTERKKKKAKLLDEERRELIVKQQMKDQLAIEKMQKLYEDTDQLREEANTKTE